MHHPGRFKVEVSYLEIYNEKVRDLLDPSKGNTRTTHRHNHSALIAPSASRPNYARAGAPQERSLRGELDR